MTEVDLKWEGSKVYTIHKNKLEQLKWFKSNKARLRIFTRRYTPVLPVKMDFSTFVYEYEVTLVNADKYDLDFDASDNESRWFVIFKPNSKEVNTMADNNTFSTLISMKMLNSVMKEGKELDIGKLFLMQQMLNGEPLQVTDVLKSKLISKFNLDSSEELPLEKVMLLQMLDGGQIDMGQLLSLRMFEEMFDKEE